MYCVLKSNLPFLVRALWFVLEIIMAKNENNSHAFISKMVENIKQTKDAQAPTDPKTNEVHISVCKSSSHTLNLWYLDNTHSFSLPLNVNVLHLLFTETLHSVWCSHAHYHVKEHHLQPGVTKRPGAAHVLLHQTRQGGCLQQKIMSINFQQSSIFNVIFLSDV